MLLTMYNNHRVLSFLWAANTVADLKRRSAWDRALQMARQQHGFDFEGRVAAVLGGRFVPTVGGRQFDGHYDGIPVSIKTREDGNSICLADYARQASIAEDFIMLVGTYRKDISGNKQFIDVDARTVPGNAWRALLHYDRAREMFEELKLISNSRVDDSRWEEFRVAHSVSFDGQRGIGPRLKLAMKRDSKTQKRIQCQMPGTAFRLFKRTFEPALDPAILEAMKVAPATPPPATPPPATPPRDKYYTCQAGVDKAIGELTGELEGVEVVVEPSAGGGAFLEKLVAAAPGATILAYDIEPGDQAAGRPVIEALDFLNDEGRVAADIAGRPAIVVGNPPYGRNSALAIKFINHCAVSLPSVTRVAFILPRSFLKPSIQQRIRGFVLEKSLELTAAEFTFEDHENGAGTPRKVPSCFQVWRRGQPPPRPVVTAPAGWQFTKLTEPYCLEVVRAGGSAGKAFLPAARRPAVANYFIRLDDPHAAAIVVATVNARHAELATACGQTTAARSLAKPPLVELLNQVVAAMRLADEALAAAV